MFSTKDKHMPFAVAYFDCEQHYNPFLLRSIQADTSLDERLINAYLHTYKENKAFIKGIPASTLLRDRRVPQHQVLQWIASSGYTLHSTSVSKKLSMFVFCTP